MCRVCEKMDNEAAHATLNWFCHCCCSSNVCPLNNDLSKAANESFYSNFGEGIDCMSATTSYAFVKDFYILVVSKIDLAFFF